MLIQQSIQQLQDPISACLIQCLQVAKVFEQSALGQSYAQSITRCQTTFLGHVGGQLLRGGFALTLSQLFAPCLS